MAARLTLASVAVMAGLVWTVNPGRYGLAGALAGLLLAAAGVAWAIREFRSHPG